MENLFQIKEEFKAVVVGFNNSGLPLGQRNDLDVFAEIAHNNPRLANMFVRLPSMDEIRAYKGDKLVESIAEPVGEAAAPSMNAKNRHNTKRPPATTKDEPKEPNPDAEIA